MDIQQSIASLPGGSATPTNFWVDAFPAPIDLFSVEDFGISTELFCKEFETVFDKLAPDEYDMRRDQILFLIRHTSLRTQAADMHQQFADYFLGKLPLEPLFREFLQELTSDLRQGFALIKPYRFRALSRFDITFSPAGSSIQRIPKASAFTQREALISREREFDFRVLPRDFQELSEEAGEQPMLLKVLAGIGGKVHHLFPECKALRIEVHHVRVVTHVQRITSNSPEGIHQDGCNMIVSALVVQRERIKGARSIIYGDDKQTELFTTTLRPGFGILQPDLYSKLWHIVSPITVDQELYPTVVDGYRSSLGFDIQLIM